MRYYFAFLGLLSFSLMLANPASALLPPNGVSASKIIFDPSIVPKVDLPVTNTKQIIDPDWIITLKPIALPDFQIPPELLNGPQISDIKMASDGERLLVEWLTDIPATGKIEYGETENYTKSLEDKEPSTDHGMVIPSEPGLLHVKISSVDAKGRQSQSPDILVTIPRLEEPRSESATTTQDEPAVKTSEPDMIGETAADKNPNTLADDASNKIESAEQNPPASSNVTITNMILGGAALILAGILIGVLIKTRKPSNEN